jgi:hypothetical protein
MALLSKISPLYFFIGFAIAIFYCYISQQPPKIVYKHPSPYNSGKIVYKSDSGECFKFAAKKLDSCPADKSMIKPQPVQD